MVLLVTLLFIATLVAIIRGKVGFARYALLAGLAILIATGSGLVPQMLLSEDSRLARSDLVWRNHSRIVVLGDGTARGDDVHQASVPLFGFSRIAVGAEAFFACRARQPDCKIVVSGGDPQKHGSPEAQVYADALKKLRVPMSDLLLEPSSRNTWENARNSAALISADDPMIVVASGYQLPRALLYFRHFHKDVAAIPSDRLTVDLSVIPSSINLLATDILLHERIGEARYYIYNELGWNPPKRV